MGLAESAVIILRALYENPRYERSIDIIAINDLANFEAMAHLTEF